MHGAYMNKLSPRLWITQYIPLTFNGFQIPLTFYFVWFSYWKIGHPCAGHGNFTWREQPPALANYGDTCYRAANISTTSNEPILRHKFSMHHNCLLLKTGFHTVFYVHLCLSYSGSCVGSRVRRFILLPLIDTNIYIYMCVCVCVCVCMCVCVDSILLQQVYI